MPHSLLMPFLALARGAAPRARLADFFTPADIARASRYRGIHYLAGFGALGAGILSAAAIGLGAGSRRVGAWSERVARGRWRRQTLLLACVVTTVPAVATLPFSVVAYFHDRSFGLRTDSLAGALVDAGKSLGFGLVVAAGAATGFIALARALPRAWPAAVAAAGVGLTFALVYVFPIVYEPAFNHFTPAPAEVRARVLAIARAEGVHVGDVLVADASRRTTASNAYVSGLGSTRRVVLWDTLLSSTPPREVDVVVAHELAHVRHRDVLKGTIFGAIGVIAGVIAIALMTRVPRLLRWLGASGAGDPHIIPFLAFFLSVSGVLTAPLQNWISRGAEASADKTAIVVTRDPDAAIALEVRLARGAISDLNPNRFIRWAFYSHPDSLERIQFALDAKQAR